MTSNSRILRAAVALGAAVASLAIHPSSEAQDAEVAIVINPGVPDQKMSPDDIEAVFRQVTKKWSNGDPVVRFTYQPGNPLRTAFEEAVLRMSPTEAQRYWIDQRIRGTAQPPRPLDNPQTMTQIIGGLKGAVGYLPARQVPANVKVVAYVRGGKIVAQ